MKRVLYFLVLICFITSCKKTVEHKVEIYPNFSYSYDLSTNMPMVGTGDTTYIQAQFRLSGSGRMLTLTAKSSTPALHVYLSQYKGVPPFNLSIMLVADDTASEQVASFDFTVKGPDVTDNQLVAAYIYHPVASDTTDCSAMFVGTYKARHGFPDTGSYIIIVTSGNGHNKIMLNNIDSLGASAYGNIECSSGNITIPLQRIGAKKYISGYTTQTSLYYESFDSTGEKLSHTYDFFKQP